MVESGKYDTNKIRPEVQLDDIKLRGSNMPPERKKAIKKALHTLHTLELMAVNIYKFQIPSAKSEHKRQLIAAMMNEMTHLQDFQIKLYEFGWRPSLLRWAFWFAGFGFGFGSRLLGKKAILKTGIWVEAKAVDHYAHLLKTIEWDDETRQVVEKNASDEDGHILKWKTLLSQMT
jgi:ubiquinone biosynthesis monooxygenase Coq7